MFRPVGGRVGEKNGGVWAVIVFSLTEAGALCAAAPHTGQEVVPPCSAVASHSWPLAQRGMARSQTIRVNVCGYHRGTLAALPSFSRELLRAVGPQLAERSRQNEDGV